MVRRMLRSHVIEVDGVFVGAAVQHGSGYRFVAVAPDVTCLNGRILPFLQDARRLAATAMRAPGAVVSALRSDTSDDAANAG